MMPLSSPARRTSASLISSTFHCGSTTAIASRVLENACAINCSDSSASRCAVTSFSVPSTRSACPRRSRASARPRTRSQRCRPAWSLMRKQTSMSGWAPRRCSCQAMRIDAASSACARSKNCASVRPSTKPGSAGSSVSPRSTATRLVVASHSHTLSPLAHSASCTRRSALWATVRSSPPGRVCIIVFIRGLHAWQAPARQDDLESAWVERVAGARLSPLHRAHRPNKLGKWVCCDHSPALVWLRLKIARSFYF